MQQRKDSGQQAQEARFTSLQELADCLDDELFIVDAEYRVQFVNAAMRRRLSAEAEAPLGRLCYEVFQGRDAPCGAPLWDCPLQKVLQSGQATTLVHPFLTSDAGSAPTTYTKLAMHPLSDEQGHVQAAVECRRDVSAERELEAQALRKRHQLLALSRISSAVSGQQDLDTILNVALDTVLEIIGGTIGGILLLDEQDHKLRYRVQRGLSARYVEGMALALGEGITGRVAQSGEPIVLTDISEDRRTVHSELVIAEGLRGFVSVPLRARNDVVGVMNVASHLPGQFDAEDMYLLDLIGYQLGTAIEQAELRTNLNSARERYQTLLRYVLTAQEEERKRIARELHDETSQMLTGLALNLQAIIEMVGIAEVQDARIKERLSKAHSLAVQAGIEVTRLINDLRPTLLDTLGLAPAIQRYVETWLEPKGIHTSMETKGTERLPAEIEVALFRIAQEALNNIVRHAEAKHARVHVECNADRCVLRIEDDGKGFDVQKMAEIDKAGRGVGLYSMKERVTLVGGSCTVESQPGQGTKILAVVPLVGGMKDAEDQSAGSG